MNSSSTVIASSGVFQIEYLIEALDKDFEGLIAVSRSLEKIYGPRSVLTKNTVIKYFNHPESLPFIARYRKEIIGYIVGIPIEALPQEPWVRTEKNYGKKNTLYTYAFVILNEFRKNGYAKMLKKVFLSKADKLSHIKYITGHVAKGVSSNFNGKIELINEVENWQGTGKKFEYYRRILD